MTFKEAAAFHMPFGKHRGKQIDEIAKRDEGLEYLLWLVDDMNHNGTKATDTKAALETYLDDPAIKKEISDL